MLNLIRDNSFFLLPTKFGSKAQHRINCGFCIYTAQHKKLSNDALSQQILLESHALEYNHAHEPYLVCMNIEDLDCEL